MNVEVPIPDGSNTFKCGICGQPMTIGKYGLETHCARRCFIETRAVKVKVAVFEK